MTEATPEHVTLPSPGRPLFSVVSAVYNVSRYLDEYIASIEAQTFDLTRLQVVLVDDGSTDDSRAVLEEWATRARCEVVVLHQENAGQAAARNAGLERATGEWVTFIDPDDTVNAKFFASMAAFAADNPEVQFLSANVVLRHEGTGELGKHPRSKMYAEDRLVDLDVATSYIPGSSTTSLMRRDVIGDLRFNAGLRPNFEDGDFAVRYLLAAPSRQTGFIGSARYYYRKRADQSSTLQTGISAVGRYSTCRATATSACSARRGSATAPYRCGSSTSSSTSCRGTSRPRTRWPTRRPPSAGTSPRRSARPSARSPSCSRPTSSTRSRSASSSRTGATSCCTASAARTGTRPTP